MNNLKKYACLIMWLGMVSSWALSVSNTAVINAETTAPNSSDQPGTSTEWHKQLVAAKKYVAGVRSGETDIWGHKKDPIHSQLRKFFDGYERLLYAEKENYKAILRQKDYVAQFTKAVTDIQQNLVQSGSASEVWEPDRLILASAYLVALHRAYARSKYSDFEQKRKKVEEALKSEILKRSHNASLQGAQGPNDASAYVMTRALQLSSITEHKYQYALDQIRDIEEVDAEVIKVSMTGFFNAAQFVKELESYQPIIGAIFAQFNKQQFETAFLSKFDDKISLSKGFNILKTTLGVSFKYASQTINKEQQLMIATAYLVAIRANLKPSYTKIAERVKNKLTATKNLYQQIANSAEDSAKQMRNISKPSQRMQPMLNGHRTDHAEFSQYLLKYEYALSQLDQPERAPLNVVVPPSPEPSA